MLPVNPPTLLPVTVRHFDSVAHQPPPIEADLPNGIRLRIPTVNVQLASRPTLNVQSANRLVRAVARYLARNEVKPVFRARFDLT
jgi:hypothetical protein